ncbi:hypothetical protein FRB96_006376 [Tulasnella sp. 330]|nr:hypothetical protein FRB96_006376 [Tulasnella sp. 330]
MATQNNSAASATPITAGQRRRHALNWHLVKPQQGPANLAYKNHFVAMVGEYVGTCLFMIFALGGTNVANIPTTSVTGATTAGQSGTQAATANTSNLLYIALSFGFSLAVNAWIFFRISGGLFNPAVSLAMALVGALTPLRAALLSISQILGGITGAAIIQALLPGTLNVRTTLSAGTSVARGLFIEMFMTALLMLAILLLAAEKSKATFIAPVGIGLALFIAELMGVFYTGGSLNPAFSLVNANDAWLGPAMGATLAAGFYKFIKYLEYETVMGPEADGEPIVVVSDLQNQQLLAGTGPMGMTNDTQTHPLPPHKVAVTTERHGSLRQTNRGSGTVTPNEREKGMMAVTGPGLGDLLTTASPEPVGRGRLNVSEKERSLSSCLHFGSKTPYQGLDNSPMFQEYDNRLERIENMLSQLLAQRHTHPAEASAV